MIIIGIFLNYKISVVAIIAMLAWIYLILKSVHILIEDDTPDRKEFAIRSLISIISIELIIAIYLFTAN